MVHNGIEYGLMQAYAEGYELLARSGLGIDVDGALDAWRSGSVVRSWLLDLLVSALQHTPDFEGISGYAKDSGEGRWTVQEAVDVASPRRSSPPRCTPGWCAAGGLDRHEGHRRPP